MLTRRTLREVAEAGWITLSRAADWMDRRSALVLVVWMGAIYVVLIPGIMRPLWYDELFTYYVATSPTWQHFVGSILNVDLNPPLGYLPVRLSLMLFGDSPAVTRLPSLAAFSAAGLVVYALVRRRLGGAYGLAAFGAFWCMGFARYAVEVRPYALLLGFLAGALWFWIRAIRAERWKGAHVGLLCCIAGMLLVHCFGPAYAVAIAFGEIVRCVLARRIDRRIWIALLAPMPALIAYIPMVRNAHALLYPPAFRATPYDIVLMSCWMVGSMGIVAGPGLVALLLMRTPRRVDRLSELARAHELAFGLATYFAAIVIIGCLTWSGVPFWSRYGIGAALGGSFGVVLLIAYKTHRSRITAAVAAVVFLGQFCIAQPSVRGIVYPRESDRYRETLSHLPFVTASGLTFLEMDRYEPPQFLSRLYYLTDRESAIRFAHGTIFEGYPILRRWLPLRANVENYHRFVATHKRFVVLATPDYPEDWLLAKLKEDGADVRVLFRMPTGYRDQTLLDVRMPTSASRDPSPNPQGIQDAGRYVAPQRRTRHPVVPPRYN